MFKIGVFKDEIEGGSIYSGPMLEQFEVESLDQVHAELVSRFGGRFAACADGKDGAFENSDGDSECFCLVSNVLRESRK